MILWWWCSPPTPLLSHVLLVAPLFFHRQMAHFHLVMMKRQKCQLNVQQNLTERTTEFNWMCVSPLFEIIIIFWASHLTPLSSSFSPTFFAYTQDGDILVRFWGYIIFFKAKHLRFWRRCWWRRRRNEESRGTIPIKYKRNRHSFTSSYIADG